MLALLFLSLIAQAAFRDPGDMPGPRSLCRRAEMNACIQDHTNARNVQLGAIAEIDDKLRMLASDNETIQRSLRAIESEARSARVTSEMSEREQAAMEKTPDAPPIFAGGPALDDIFFLRGQPNSWAELHAEKRRARLNTLSLSSLGKIAELEPLQRNLTMEIQALAASTASLSAERSQRAQQVNVHAGMCAEGCKMQFCREE
jgi:hypothetical protein